MTSAALTQRLVAIAQQVQAAAHGTRGAIYTAACEELGLSRATLLRQLKQVSVCEPRKQRADARCSALTIDEARLISGMMIESARKNDKQLYTLGDAVEALRANGLIMASRVDTDTGEIMPLSDSAIGRALRSYGLHPEQLLAPAPVTELQSLHPNHVWQIDASLCVLYYLKSSQRGAENGLRVMDQAEFYKNKPRNLARISADRVWSYEITDHASGWIYVEYVMGAESGENLCSVLINAMQERGGADMLHGVPRILYMDPGSANTAAMTRNLARSLGIELIAHKAGNARATGQVENARNLIERKFEAALKFAPVNSLDELNARAATWRGYYNATAVHSRHGRTRSAAWMLIRSAQLIKAPSIEVCRELAIAEPVERKVKPTLRVAFGGHEFDVSSVPGLLVGQKVLVTRNPWRSDAAQVVMTGEDGHEVFYVVPKVEVNEFGFAQDTRGTAVIGERFARHADTPAQEARKVIEQVMTETDSVKDAEEARKRQALPLGGKLDPYKHIHDTELPSYLPRRGTEHELRTPVIETPPISTYALAKRAQAEISDWSPEHYDWLCAHYPDGAKEDDFEAVLDAVRAAFDRRPMLSVVGGA